MCGALLFESKRRRTRAMAMDAVPSDTTGVLNIGNTRIRTLRKAYGVHFAKGCRDDEKLRDVLHRLDESSLSTLIYDQQHGKLDEKLSAGRGRQGSAAAKLDVMFPG
jgi:hypothetical protein